MKVRLLLCHDEDVTDLPAEKIIYGKDFIYTKDIERFSDIVAMYLKKIIKN